LVWGFWHAPLIVQGLNYPEHPWLGVFLTPVHTLLEAPLFSDICLKADSVVAAAIFHGSSNGLSVLATMGLEGGNDLLVGGTGLAGFHVLLAANIGLVAFDGCFGGNGITRSSGRAGELAAENMRIIEARPGSMRDCSITFTRAGS
jgi:hypothetical protein